MKAMQLPITFLVVVFIGIITFLAFSVFFTKGVTKEITPEEAFTKACYILRADFDCNFEEIDNIKVNDYPDDLYTLCKNMFDLLISKKECAGLCGCKYIARIGLAVDPNAGVIDSTGPKHV